MPAPFPARQPVSPGRSGAAWPAAWPAAWRDHAGGGQRGFLRQRPAPRARQGGAGPGAPGRDPHPRAGPGDPRSPHGGTGRHPHPHPSAGLLQVTERRQPLSSVSSLEVHFDLLDLTELTDMSDQELAEVFADSDEENAAGESPSGLQPQAVPRAGYLRSPSWTRAREQGREKKHLSDPELPPGTPGRLPARRTAAGALRAAPAPRGGTHRDGRGDRHAHRSPSPSPCRRRGGGTHTWVQDWYCSGGNRPRAEVAPSPAEASPLSPRATGKGEPVPPAGTRGCPRPRLPGLVTRAGHTVQPGRSRAGTGTGAHPLLM
uniref:Dysbindin domain-containing protein 1 n=1 Tax=Aquila chrysaetos chrysaetos TaxID=223781 RepID=A0A663F9I3_AQUCH